MVFFRETLIYCLASNILCCSKAGLLENVAFDFGWELATPDSRLLRKGHQEREANVASCCPSSSLPSLFNVKHKSKRRRRGKPRLHTYLLKRTRTDPVQRPAAQDKVQTELELTCETKQKQTFCFKLVTPTSRWCTFLGDLKFFNILEVKTELN